MNEDVREILWTVMELERGWKELREIGRMSEDVNEIWWMY
jgi:hypothetical protein